MAAELQRIELPPAPAGTGHAIEQLLAHRRSRREFRSGPLGLNEIARLLWAVQGISDPRGLRTAPSAGALYPLETHLVAGSVTGLAPGAYRYSPSRHSLAPTSAGDCRAALARAALGQEAISQAAAVIALTAVYRRTTVKYGERGMRYVHMEIGHAAQNVYLMAESLGIGTVMVGAFDDERVGHVIPVGADEAVLALLPLGRLG